MYYLEKRIEISASHALKLNYKSKCQNLHGHNWIIIIYCKRGELDSNGMIIDFSLIKKAAMELDHCNLNEKFDNNSTAENIAEYLQSTIPYCYKVKVQESEGNIVIYEI